MTNCNCRPQCSLIGVIVAIGIGIVGAILRYTAIVNVTPAFLWVLFGIAIVVLASTPITSALIRMGGRASCVCSSLGGILAGTLGTVLTSVLLLGITFAATSAVGAVIFGLLAGFFTLTLASIACLALCIAKCGCTEM